MIALISAIVEPIQLTPDWYFVMAGWGLSVTGALLGSWMARRKGG